jgi:hypothetical protein
MPLPVWLRVPDIVFLRGAVETRESTGLMRVLETLPPFTLRLSAAFVNGNKCISTGFLRVFPDLTGFWLKMHKFAGFIPGNSCWDA